MANWAALNTGKPDNTDLGDMDDVADRIDNLETGLDGTSTLSAVDIQTSAAISTSDALSCAGNLAVNTNKMTVTAASGNTAVAGTLDVTGVSTLTGGVDAGGSGTALKCKVINIGDWDMVSDASTTVAHGLTDADIRMVHVIIRHDTTTWYFPLNYGLTALGGAAIPAGGWVITGGYIVLYRVAGELFDDVAYDSTSFNRGWVTIWYEA